MPCAPDSRNCGLLWLQREAKEAEAAAACGSIAAAAGAAAQAIAFDAALGRARIERRGGMGAALRGIERIRRLIAAEAETAAEGELRAAARSAALRHRLVQLQETMCTPCGVSRSRWGREKEEKEEDEEEEEEVTLYRALAVLREYAISDPRNIHETHNSDGSQVDRVDRATFDVVKRRLLFELRHAETETAELEKSVARLRETHESLSRHRKDEHEKLSALHLEKMVLKNRIAVYENTR